MMLTPERNFHGYQRKIANRICSKPASFICAEMGLGKTAPTLAAIRYLQKQRHMGPALVIAPLRVCFTSWPDECGNWGNLSGTKVHILHGKGKVKNPPSADIYLVNFEGIPFIVDSKLFRKCEILVVDESSMIKSHKAKTRFKLLSKICTKFKKRILLTGTPSPSGELWELFTQAFILDGGDRFGKSYWQFQRNYYESDFMGYNWTLKPKSRQKIENKMRDITISLSAKDYLDLPTRHDSIVPIQIPAKTQEIYDEMEKEFIIKVGDETITAANAAVMSSKLRQITAGAMYLEGGEDYTYLHDEKVKALQEICETTGENILCGFQFRFEKTLIKKKIPGAKFIDGSVSAKKSLELIKAWNAGAIPLLCCHPASIAHGVNLQDGGRRLVWLSPDWSLERTQQFNARIYRQGQKKRVFIQVIRAENTIDAVISGRLQTKDAGQKELMKALKTYCAGKR